MIEWTRDALYPLLLATGVTLATTPLVRRGAIARQWYDRPDGGLKPHQRPIPYLGGAAIYLGWLAAVAYAAVTLPEWRRALACIAAAGTVLMLTGLIDDLRDLRPRVKLAMQALAAGLLLFGGVGREIGPMILRELSVEDPAAWNPWVPAAFGGVVVIALLLGGTNATNLIDGLDGLCAGVMAVAAMGYLALAATTGGIVAGGAGPLLVMLSAALLGGCLGFLPFNFNPARIFMGDGGSLLLGFGAALSILLFVEQAGARAGLGALMILGFPVLDTALAIARRWRNGRPLFAGDRSHLYDQMCDRGWSVRRTALVCYAIAVAFAGLGLASARLAMMPLLMLYGGVVVGTALLLGRLGMVRVDAPVRRE